MTTVPAGMARRAFRAASPALALAVRTAWLGASVGEDSASTTRSTSREVVPPRAKFPSWMVQITSTPGWVLPVVREAMKS